MKQEYYNHKIISEKYYKFELHDEKLFTVVAWQQKEKTKDD